MGTSQSSTGSPSGVSMVPPWVPDVATDVPSQSDDTNSDDINEDSKANPNSSQELAPHGRFGPARSALGDYAKEGREDSLKGGLSQYVRRGYGGSKTAARRMGLTAQTAEALYAALMPGEQNPFSTDKGALDPALISGLNVSEVMDAVVEAVRPVDGTLDVEASRCSVKDALSSVLDSFPNADFTNLNEQQRELAITTYVAGDVFRRIDLDLGKTIREKAPSALTGMQRLKEVKDYIHQSIAASFRKLKLAGQRLSANRIPQIVKAAIADTFEVFEGYSL